MHISFSQNTATGAPASYWVLVDLHFNPPQMATAVATLNGYYSEAEFFAGAPAMTTIGVQLNVDPTFGATAFTAVANNIINTLGWTGATFVSTIETS